MDVHRKPASILVVDGPESATDLAGALTAAGHEVQVCSNAARARRLLREHEYGVLLCDPEASGFEPTSELAQLGATPAWIQLAGFGSVEDAVEAVRRGAADYLEKPTTDEQVLLAVARALESSALRSENKNLKERLGERFELGQVVSRDAQVQRILQSIEVVADTRATILIEGESGTGKTLIARTIHQSSSRRQGPFVEVNCGALPDDLLESELFGHVKGAFTGAVRDKAGKFEAADGGTIFLDEIGTASSELQIKLLRVLQDRVFERVGDTRTRSTDVRVIAATNERLEAAVREGRFREDLYWRLRVIAFELPPLRARPADVPLLTERFLARFSAEHARGRKVLSPAAQSALVSHDWPGNVRELEHCIERAVLLSAGETIEVADLGLGSRVAIVSSNGSAPPDTTSDGTNAAARAVGAPATDRSAEPCVSPAVWFRPGVPLRELIEAPEREILRAALAHCGGSRKATARMLDVNRTTLFNKMKRYNLMEFPAGPEYKNEALEDS